MTVQLITLYTVRILPDESQILNTLGFQNMIEWPFMSRVLPTYDSL